MKILITTRLISHPKFAVSSGIIEVRLKAQELSKVTTAKLMLENCPQSSIYREELPFIHMEHLRLKHANQNQIFLIKYIHSSYLCPLLSIKNIEHSK